MREILSIQVGECGNRIGRRFWEELCKEHSLDEGTGHRLSDYKDTNGVVESLDVFFDENKDGGYLPRALLTDLDSGAIDSIFSGSSGRLFRQEYATSGFCGSGGNFAKAQNEGREIMEDIMDTVQKSIECCDSFQGFQLFHSASGGTGSGLNTLLLESLRMYFPDKIVSTSTVMPTKNSMNGVLSSYNTILQLSSLVENVDYTKFYDNEALYNISRKKIGLENATMEDLNGIIAQSLCGETSAFRFNGLVNNNMRKVATNLVLFPRIHFFITSSAPFCKMYKGVDQTELPVKELIRQLFIPSHFLTSVDPKRGRYYTASTTIRGDVSTSSVEDEMYRVSLYQSSYFVEWICNSFQTSYCKVAPQGLKRSATLLAISSSIGDYFKDVSEQFTKLFRKSAFVNWYTSEGMDEMEFTEAESNCNDVISEYYPWGCWADDDPGEEDEPQPDELSY